MKEYFSLMNNAAKSYRSTWIYDFWLTMKSQKSFASFMEDLGTNNMIKDAFSATKEI